MPETPTHDELALLDRHVVCLLGLPFDVLTLAGTVAHLRAAASRRKPCWLSTPNLNFLIAAHQDAQFRRSVLLSELSVADGMPVIWLARLLGLPLHERVAGSDVFEALHQGGDTQPMKCYFFGGPEGAAEAACQRVNARGGAMRCVGWQSPGFGSMDSMSTDEVIGTINATGPDFVVVSLGAKKGQTWIERNRPNLQAPLISHLGAVVNFEAGTVRRAPPAWRRIGLEWLWRIVQEPALWRRYANDAVALLPMLWRQVLPLVWARWRRSPNPQPLEAQVDHHTNGTRLLRLTGSCTRDSLERLKDGCRQALSVPGPVEIDLSAVSDIDAEAMGTLLMLQSVQLRRGLACQVVRVSEGARRRLQQHGCADLLGPASR